MLEEGRKLVEKLSLEEMQSLVTLNEIFMSAFTKMVLSFNKQKKYADTDPVIFPLDEKSDGYLMEVQLVKSKGKEEYALKISLVKMSEKKH